MDHPWFRFYDEGVPKNIEIKDDELNLYDHLSSACARYPNHIALDFLGKKINYAELLYLIDVFANNLISVLGIKRRDNLAILLPNCPEFIISFFAAQKIRAVAVPINPLISDEDLVKILNQRKAKLVITLTKFGPKIIGLGNKIKTNKFVLAYFGEFLPWHKEFIFNLFIAKKDGHIISNNFSVPNGCFDFSDLIRIPENSKSCLDLSCADQKTKDSNVNDLAVLQYTSGTTGDPKGVMLSSRNLFSNFIQTKSWMRNFKDGEEVMLAVLPFFHVYGLTVIMIMGLLSGSRLIILPQFKLKDVLKSIAKNRVSILHAVPVIYRKIGESQLSKKMRFFSFLKTDFSSLKTCISGAAPLPKEIKEQFEKVTKVKLIEGYGLSEASPVTHINPLQSGGKIGSIGLPIPSTEVKILDIDDIEKELRPNEIGRLAIKGPQVMQGYFKNPEETTKTLRNGWLLTKDVAYMDEDGFFYIIDRLDDMINVGGLKVWPAEVEKIIKNHPAIQDVMVKGESDPKIGQTVKAFVVLKKGKSLISEELIEFCARYLPKYETPTKIEFKDELPRSIIGKAIKKNL